VWNLRVTFPVYDLPLPFIFQKLSSVVDGDVMIACNACDNFHNMR
jgi:hypothetical protein